MMFHIINEPSNQLVCLFWHVLPFFTRKLRLAVHPLSSRGRGGKWPAYPAHKPLICNATVNVTVINHIKVTIWCQKINCLASKDILFYWNAGIYFKWYYRAHGLLNTFGKLTNMTLDSNVDLFCLVLWPLSCTTKVAALLHWAIDSLRRRQWTIWFHGFHFRRPSFLNIFI